MKIGQCYSSLFLLFLYSSSSCFLYFLACFCSFLCLRLIPRSSFPLSSPFFSFILVFPSRSSPPLVFLCLFLPLLCFHGSVLHSVRLPLVSSFAPQCFFFVFVFGFFFFFRDEDNSKADSSLCCPSPFSPSLCEFVTFLLCISALFF